MLGIREASSFALDLFFPQKQYGKYLKLVLSKSIALTPTNNPATELEIRRFRQDSVPHLDTVLTM
jgi:hypothetical protein